MFVHNIAMLYSMIILMYIAGPRVRPASAESGHPG